MKRDGVWWNRVDEKRVAAFMDKARAIREDKDPAFKQAKATFKNIPAFLMRRLLNAIGFLLYTLNLDLRWAGSISACARARAKISVSTSRAVR